MSLYAPPTTAPPHEALAAGSHARAARMRGLCPRARA